MMRLCRSQAEERIELAAIGAIGRIIIHRRHHQHNRQHGEEHPQRRMHGKAPILVGNGMAVMHPPFGELIHAGHRFRPFVDRFCSTSFLLESRSPPQETSGNGACSRQSRINRPCLPPIICLAASPTACMSIPHRIPRGPVAQLDRALPSEGKGRRFESFRVRH